ncbi:hypothetical protein [Pedobacter sp. UBA5917]|uniref:hypothetical protein n=1 Tax=Pedobacter sp. UBA5917 TaxID=1947061 RepID=UPI0025F3614B|nr:hypothetical protein [Pedobacter sp. UBA5917]
MDLNKINTLLFETLDSIAAIGTSKVSMFDKKDKYSYMPFFRFKFKNKKKDDKIYKDIEVVINSFKGNVKWGLTTKL